MPAKASSRKSRLLDYLARRGISVVTRAEWRELLELLAPISEDALRHLLHRLGVPAEQPLDGVRQGSLDQLECSLLALHKVYEGGRDQARVCRRLVIQAKDRARMLARHPKADPERKALKEEMALWMLVWLENPDVFESWAGLRKRAIARDGPPANGAP
ncbi:MAG: hypothetical protein WD696_10070 [Bryobacteraceae bacterium]